MKYKLMLIAADKVNNQVIRCDTGKEAYHYKKKAEYMGFTVVIRKNKEAANESWRNH